jgi:hypothetical protein
MNFHGPNRYCRQRERRPGPKRATALVSDLESGYAALQWWPKGSGGFRPSSTGSESTFLSIATLRSRALVESLQPEQK